MGVPDQAKHKSDSHDGTSQLHADEHFIPHISEGYNLDAASRMGENRFIVSGENGVNFVRPSVMFVFRRTSRCVNHQNSPVALIVQRNRETSSAPPGSNMWHSASPIGVANCQGVFRISINQSDFCIGFRTCVSSCPGLLRELFRSEIQPGTRR